MNDGSEAAAQQRATIERVAEMIHEDERTLARVFELLPGGNIVGALVHVLAHEPWARCVAWAIARLIHKNPMYVASLFEHSLFCDVAADEWSDEKLLTVLRERLNIDPRLP
jgi:hypothetical protein